MQQLNVSRVCVCGHHRVNHPLLNAASAADYYSTEHNPRHRLEHNDAVDSRALLNGNSLSIDALRSRAYLALGRLRVYPLDCV